MVSWLAWTASVQFLAGARISLFPKISRQAVRHTHPPIKWITKDLFQWLKCPEHETDHTSS